MQDPSIDMKIFLGEQAEDIVQELGRAARQLVKSSDAPEVLNTARNDFHEMTDQSMLDTRWFAIQELIRIAKEFSTSESSIEKTEKQVKQIALAAEDMETR